VRNDALRDRAAACAKCGTCRTVCTLYPERKDERAVARGKIALLDGALSGRNGNFPAVREALADCLLCGRCARACPGQVPVEEIVMAGRAALAEALGLSAWKRVLFGTVMPKRRAVGAVRTAAAAAQRLLPGRIPTASGLHYRFPEAFGFSGRTLPAIPAASFTGSLAPGEALRGDVVLFAGCVFDHLLPQVGRAAYETVRVSGKAVAVLRDAACCGLPAMAAGDRAGAVRCVEENVRRLSAAGPEAIVFPCGSCLLMFRRLVPALLSPDHPLREEAVRLSDICIDYATFLLASGVADRLPGNPGARGEAAVGYHDPCHLSGTLGKGKEAREALRRAVGRGFGEMDGASLCCGYGGTFNVRDYGTSVRIGERKIALAARGGTRVVATACSGCLLHLRDAAARADPSLRIVHLAEVVSGALPYR
jgi:glycolate oxidase iron-sulfur subunit